MSPVSVLNLLESTMDSNLAKMWLHSNKMGTVFILVHLSFDVDYYIILHS